MHLHQDAFKVVSLITFGQPRFLSQKGAEKVTLLPALRIVDPRDIVPRIFPGFLHSGPELLLLAGPHYAYTTEILPPKDITAAQIDPTALKATYAHHTIESYVNRLQPKYSDSTNVKISEVEKFL